MRCFVPPSPPSSFPRTGPSPVPGLSTRFGLRGAVVSFLAFPREPFSPSLVYLEPLGLRWRAVCALLCPPLSTHLLGPPPFLSGSCLPSPAHLVPPSNVVWPAHHHHHAPLPPSFGGFSPAFFFRGPPAPSWAECCSPGPLFSSQAWACLLLPPGGLLPRSRAKIIKVAFVVFPPVLRLLPLSGLLSAFPDGLTPFASSRFPPQPQGVRGFGWGVRA